MYLVWCVIWGAIAYLIANERKEKYSGLDVEPILYFLGTVLPCRHPHRSRSAPDRRGRPAARDTGCSQDNPGRDKGDRGRNPWEARHRRRSDPIGSLRSPPREDRSAPSDP